MTLLRRVPGVLARAFSTPEVSYNSAGETFLAISEAHINTPRQRLEQDADGAREIIAAQIEITAPAATAPTLTIGQRVRCNSITYAVREIQNDSAHGTVTWIADRAEVRTYNPDRGNTR